MPQGPELFGSSAPVFVVDGERQGALARDLLQLDVSEDTQGMKHLDARFTAWGPTAGGRDEGELHLDGSVLDFGRRIEVSLGPTAQPRTVFAGRISALQADYAEGHEPQLQVLAEDDLMPLRWMHRC